MEERTNAPLVIVAILTPRPGALELFREYETRAARILKRYGGAVERTVVEEDGGAGTPAREVHVITLPDRAAFDRYRTDPELASLSGMRAAAIFRTELLLGRAGPDYT